MSNLSDKAGSQVAGKRYISLEQTITAAGSLTLAHGLGVEPVMIRAYLVCKVANLGYVIGDKVDVDTHGETRDGQGATVGHGVSIVPDATNLTVRFGSSATTFALIRKDSGVVASAVNTSWRLVIVATASVVGLSPQMLGDGQTWQDVVGSRALGTTYTNSTGRTVVVTCSVASLGVGSFGIIGTIDGITLEKAIDDSAGFGYQTGISMIVPNGSTYTFSKFNANTDATPTIWVELR